jgi:hypothetical protein
MAVNGSERHRSGEAEVCPGGDVLIGTGISVLLQKTEIDEIYHSGMHPNAHENVGGFEITVNVVARVNVLQATKLGLQISKAII